MNAEIVVTLALLSAPVLALLTIYVFVPFVRWAKLALVVRQEEDRWHQRSQWMAENMPEDAPQKFREQYAGIINPSPLRKRSTADLIADRHTYQSSNDARSISDAISRRLQRGQGMLEYSMIIVLATIIVLIILVLLGPAIGEMFSNIAS
jgi:pilus assembly protein Flp/PilA